MRPDLSKGGLVLRARGLVERHVLRREEHQLGLLEARAFDESDFGYINEEFQIVHYSAIVYRSHVH